MADNFFDEVIIEFPFRESENKYGTRTIGVQLKPRGAKTLPELDPAYLTLEPPDYLRPFDAHREGEIVVFQATVRDEFVAQPNFADLVRDPLHLTVMVPKKVARPGDRPYKGTFDARIEIPRRVRWESWPEDDPSQITRYTENQPIELDPDGKSAFVLRVWLEEWRAAGGWEKKTGDYGFSHWLAPDDPYITLDVVSPQPVPWAPELRGSAQESTTWRSKMVLPNPDRPGLQEFPLDTVIRVRAWKQSDILTRIGQPPYVRLAPDAKQLAEVEVPLRLGSEKLLITLKEPETPLWANHLPLRLKFAMVVERTGDPYQNKPIFWQLITASEGSVGELKSGQGQTDAGGEISIDYTPPQLFDKPNIPKSERIQFFFDSRHRKKTGEAVEIPLKPQGPVFVRLRLGKRWYRALDHEIQFKDPYKEVHGKVVRDKDGQKLPVAKVPVTAQIFANPENRVTPLAARPTDGGVDIATATSNVRTDENGEFTVTIPEGIFAPIPGVDPPRYEIDPPLEITPVKLRVDTMAWIPHAMVLAPDPLIGIPRPWVTGKGGVFFFKGDNWKTPSENSFVAGTHRARQWIEFQIVDWESGAYEILNSYSNIGESHGYWLNGNDYASWVPDFSTWPPRLGKYIPPTSIATATADIDDIIVGYDTEQDGATVTMEMAVGIPLTSVPAATPQIRWILRLMIGSGGSVAMDLKCKGFPSYAVFATADGVTKRFYWQDVSSVSSYDVVDIGLRLSMWFGGDSQMFPDAFHFPWRGPFIRIGGN